MPNVKIPVVKSLPKAGSKGALAIKDGHIFYDDGYRYVELVATNHIMGEMAFYDNSTSTVITTRNVYTKVNIAASLMMGHSFDMPSNSRLRYIGDEPIMAHCGCTFSIRSLGVSDICFAVLYKNGGVNGNNEFTSGTQLSHGKVQQKLGSVDDAASTAIHVMCDMVKGDYLELGVLNFSDADDFVVIHMNLFAVGRI